MECSNWRYYNHAILPNVPPHETADLECIKNNSIWKMYSKAVLVRWTSEFDCDKKTNWWYIIKDSSFDLTELKSKRRYEINKGRKNFDVVEIDPKDYKDEIFLIQREAYASYPAKYRPVVFKDKLFAEIESWEYYKFYGAFSKENHQLVGYAWLNRDGRYIYYAFHKVRPMYEKYGVNAAIIYEILCEHNKELNNGAYICDGARSISHETNFQNYLEKYFGFRKAYCKLNIEYRPFFGGMVNLLFPFRLILSKLDCFKVIHNINGILKMEYIMRNES